MDRAQHCVDLAEACPVLVRHKQVLQLVAEAVGPARLGEALTMMRSGTLSGDLGDTVHDALLDPIINDAQPVWSGLISGSEGDYPVTVSHYCGVYWAQALECDPVGFFLDRDHAIGYVMSNWEGVREVVTKRAKKRQAGSSTAPVDELLQALSKLPGLPRAD